MSDDLIARLHDIAEHPPDSTPTSEADIAQTCEQAADRIAALEAENSARSLRIRAEIVRHGLHDVNSYEGDHGMVYPLEDPEVHREIRKFFGWLNDFCSPAAVLSDPTTKETES